MMFIMILLACALTFAITPMIWHLCSQIDQFKIDIKDAKEIEKLKAFIIGLKKPYHEILVLVYATFACCCLIFCIFTILILVPKNYWGNLTCNHQIHFSNNFVSNYKKKMVSKMKNHLENQS